LSPLLFNLYINDLPQVLKPLHNPPMLNDRAVECLMYADDLVIITLSADELQQQLNRLETYCQQWLLNINVKKTKVMVIAKSRSKVPKVDFTLNNVVLEQVGEYMYLGMLFDCTGSMKTAQNSIKLRALKAIFKLRSSLRNCDLKPGLALKLFDQLIKPICLYGSEIWGNLPRTISTYDKRLFKLFDELPTEKVHIRYCKFTLGVHSKAVNCATQGELGRCPIYIDMIMAMLKFFIHVRENEPGNLLIRAAYQECATLHKLKKKSWFACIYNIVKIIGLPGLAHVNKTNLNLIRTKLRQKFIQEWGEAVHGGEPDECNIRKSGKLSLYREIKTGFYREGYLQDITIKKDRAALCKLRISAHRLNIERGRYNRVPREQRFCLYCNETGTQVVEDEYHCIIECGRVENVRRIVFDKISQLNCKFYTMCSNDKCTYLMTAEGEISRVFGTLCSAIVS
jgi:ribonuclease I